MIWFDRDFNLAWRVLMMVVCVCWLEALIVAGKRDRCDSKSSVAVTMAACLCWSFVWDFLMVFCVSEGILRVVLV